MFEVQGGVSQGSHLTVLLVQLIEQQDLVVLTLDDPRLYVPPDVVSLPPSLIQLVFQNLLALLHLPLESRVLRDQLVYLPSKHLGLGLQLLDHLPQVQLLPDGCLQLVITGFQHHPQRLDVLDTLSPFDVCPASEFHHLGLQENDPLLKTVDDLVLLRYPLLEPGQLFLLLLQVQVVSAIEILDSLVFDLRRQQRGRRVLDHWHDWDLFYLIQGLDLLHLAVQPSHILFQYFELLLLNPVAVL